MSRTQPPTRLYIALILLTLGSLACTLTAQATSKQAALASVATVQPTSNQLVSKISPTPAASLTPAGGAVCIVTAQALNVRACPGVDCAVIAWLRSGQAVNAAPAGPGWLLIDLADGRPGYIAARYCDGGQP